MDDLDEMPVPSERPITYLKNPLLWAFYYLKNEYTFENAIKDMISRKGDTEMNATIVGALLGAAYGATSIDSDLLDKVLRLDTDRGDYTPKN